MPSELGAEDLEWLRSQQQHKVLDEARRFTGVAACGQDSRPLVLSCYPLKSGKNVSFIESGMATKAEWQASLVADAVELKLFWLVCPNLAARVGRLEARGFARKCHARLQAEPESLEMFNEQQRECAQTQTPPAAPCLSLIHL